MAARIARWDDSLALRIPDRWPIAAISSGSTSTRGAVASG